MKIFSGNPMQQLSYSLCLITAFSAATVVLAEEKTPKLPEGYKLQYQQSMDSPAAMAEFVFTDPAAWKMKKQDDRLALGLVGKSKYKPKHRSPYNMAMIPGMQFGDFILEVQLQQTGKEYGHRDMCLFFGMEDPEHFYYSHIATKTDSHAHNIFIVNDAPRLKVSDYQTKGFDWGKPGTWQKVRLEREASTGKIAIYVNDQPKPIMTAVDKSFGAGWIGFGSFDDTGLVDDIKVWAPDVVEKKIPFFKSAEVKE